MKTVASSLSRQASAGMGYRSPPGPAAPRSGTRPTDGAGSLPARRPHYGRRRPGASCWPC
eukprot:6698085-Alexandrium_andersonii.AAC.1